MYKYISLYCRSFRLLALRCDMKRVGMSYETGRVRVSGVCVSIRRPKKKRKILK